jgi:hypothetical protein
MSDLSSLFHALQTESWRPALRQYRRKILNRKSKGSVSDNNAIVIESKDPFKSPSVVTVEADSLSENTIEISTYSALQVVGKGTYAINDACPIPEFQNDNELIIRNHAVGLNPIDWKSLDYNFNLPAFPWVTGRECAGVVEKVAPGVTKFKVGDRVWTSKYTPN